MNNLNNQLENAMIHKRWCVFSLKADSCWSNDLFCQHVGILNKNYSSHQKNPSVEAAQNHGCHVFFHPQQEEDNPDCW